MLAFPVLLATLVGCVKPPPPPPQPTFSLTSPARQAFTDQAIYQSTLESIANVPLAAMVLAVLAVLVLGRRAAAHAGNAMAQPSLERALAVVLVAAGCGAWGETMRQLAGIARASDSEG